MNGRVFDWRPSRNSSFDYERTLRFSLLTSFSLRGMQNARAWALVLAMATVAGVDAFQLSPNASPFLSPAAKFSRRPFARSGRPIRSAFDSPSRLRVGSAVDLKMSADAVEAAEMDERIYTFNKVVIDTVYNIICAIYPVSGGKRDFARFYVLETVARVPYFAYLSVMHLRETFGERDPKLGERMRTHYAEADNELHHLLIMEALGGNSSIVDRTIGMKCIPCAPCFLKAVGACGLCLHGSLVREGRLKFRLS